MLKKNRLFTPGPTPLLPPAQMAMASYGAHHRTAEFRALFTRVLADVKEFIGTKNDVLVLTSSGTGFMEASVSNLTSPGDRALVLTAGKFGERWTSLAKALGMTSRRERGWCERRLPHWTLCSSSTRSLGSAQPISTWTPGESTSSLAA